MTVTIQADIEVGTADLRAAIAAVLPHRSKVKTGDDMGERNLRLTFGAGVLFISASNQGNTTALAKVDMLSDTRGALGHLDKDDAPMLVDLAPHRAQLILQTFKLGGNNADVQQIIRMHLSADPQERFISFTDVGGFWEGESSIYPLSEPGPMPDVLDITAKALANMGADPMGKPLVADATMLDLFKSAGDAYETMLEIRSVGTKEASGFIVKAGPDFVGTMESHHGAGDGQKKRDAQHNAWLKLLPATQLRSA